MGRPVKGEGQVALARCGRHPTGGVGGHSAGPAEPEPLQPSVLLPGLRRSHHRLFCPHLYWAGPEKRGRPCTAWRLSRVTNTPPSLTRTLGLAGREADHTGDRVHDRQTLCPSKLDRPAHGHGPVLPRGPRQGAKGVAIHCPAQTAPLSRYATGRIVSSWPRRQSNPAVCV